MVKVLPGIASCICLTLTFVHSAFCDANAQLRSGMRFGEVVAIKGDPKEKDVHGLKNVVLWRYTDTTLKFIDGRLEIPEIGLPAHSMSTSKTRTVSTRRRTKTTGNLSQDVVDQIIDELPNDTGKPSTAPMIGDPLSGGVQGMQGVE